MAWGAAATIGSSVRFSVSTVRYGYLEIAATVEGSRTDRRIRSGRVARAKRGRLGCAASEAFRLQSAATDYVRSRSPKDWYRYPELRAELLADTRLQEFIEPFPTRADFDPLPHWRRVRVPVFAAWGGENIRVPARESRGRLRAVLDSPPSLVAHELHLYDGSGHGLEDPSTGMLREDFVDDLVRWIEATLHRME